MKITGAKAVIKALEKEGVEYIFGYPGGAILPVYDELNTSTLKHVLVRHEQGAAHAASGYSRVTGKVGVCLSTSGPGATNLITGIATAYMDSIPMVAITGQVSTNVIGHDVFQEVDITGATDPFTKNNYLVKKVEDLPRILKEAFHIATTGRPGPVLIDIPKDIQMAELDFLYPEKANLLGYKPTYKGHPRQIKKAVEAIMSSDKPMIIVGGGGVMSDVKEEIIELAERIDAPVATTMMGISAFPASHRLYLGMLGGDHGVFAAKKAIEEADLLIVMGARMADRSTGKTEEFAKRAQVIHIDVDPAEIGKNILIDIPIVGELKQVLKDMLKKDFSKNNPTWCQQSEEWKQVINGVGEKVEGLNPMVIIKSLSDQANKNTIIATDVGQHQLWVGRYYAFEKPRTFLTSGGLGTMGYGLPAAIGAKLGKQDQEVVLVTGDGSFQMNLTEMATAVQEGLTIKIIILNNSCLGMVRELQQHYCEERYNQVAMKGNPDFCQLAKAYGFKAKRVNKPDEIEESIKELLSEEGSFVMEFQICDSANVIPKEGGCLR
ncbi:biosynthetic-type acetolactate synthase large subunit [Tindallia californiensis]|uniref:Acetolactate synthase n=1 Tax=Tindallia californiensis TaxID=159292 RepID=A0A1H3JRC5_9FIRM|nr:biosynthetic-type acetolactate synthase large subunit [Tindallia californiensis]SDY42493.1 acetolactate synthase, large subunit [Tindallia californiensis]